LAVTVEILRRANYAHLEHDIAPVRLIIDYILVRQKFV